MTTPTSLNILSAASLLKPFTPEDFATYGGVESEAPHIFMQGLRGDDGLVVLLDGSRIEVHFVDGRECEVEVWTTTVDTDALARMVADSICASVSALIRNPLESYEQDNVVQALKDLSFTRIL